jgi:phosphoribosylformimino-5-aminoimidazole carboxamide ribotide isomerase
MRIIPVIDLLDGRAVHARGGQRRLYRPLSTGLCHDPDPLAVVSAYLGVHAFPVLYLADLDALQDQGDNMDVIRALLHRFRKVRFWLDAGRGSMASAATRLLPVLGTETGISAEEVLRLAKGTRFVLSLDFRGQNLLGDTAILKQPSRWPCDVIVMELTRVGARRGPAVERIRRLKQQATGKRIYAGGGLRDETDLQRLAAAGAAGVLTATALHDRVLDGAVIRRWSKKKPRPGPGRVVG